MEERSRLNQLFLAKAGVVLLFISDLFKIEALAVS